MPAPQARKVDHIRLKQLVAQHFNISELKEMCDALGVDYEQLGGEGRNDKVRELIGYFLRRQRLEDLIEYCRSERPAIAWNKEVWLSPISRGIPNNLPGPGYNEFVMREREFLQTVEDLEGQFPFAVIVGMGGVGKTSLAREIAGRCIDGTYPLPQYDAVVWITDRGREGSTTLNVVLNEIVRTLDYPGVAQKELEDKEFDVSRLLRQQRVLVVVDNYETITDARLHNWLRRLPAPSKALITSRGATGHSAGNLRSGSKRPEQYFRVELRGMAAHEARQFIDQRRQMVDMRRPLSDKELDLLIEITGGNPKALEMAIGYLKYRSLPVDELVEILYEQKGDLFDHLFADAWSMLDEHAQRLLTVIPLFPGSAPKPALREIAQLRAYDVDKAIEQLVSLSLVDPEEAHDDVARFSLHPLVRAFAQSKFESDPDFARAATERWLAWIAQFLKAVEWPWQDLARLKQVEPDEESAYAAIRWAHEHHRSETVIELARGVDHYYYVRGFWEKKAQVDQWRIAAARALEDLEEEALSLSQYAQMLCTRGNKSDLVEVADEHLPRLDQIATQSELSTDTTVSLRHAHAFYHIGRRDYDSAYAILAATQETADLAQPKYRIANRHWSARCLYKKGDAEEAEALFLTALAEAQESNYERSVAFCQRNLAEIALKRGDVDTAAELLRSALALSREFQDRRYIAKTQLVYAGYYLARQDYRAAQEALADAKDNFTRLGVHADDEQLRALEAELSRFVI